MLVGNDVDLRSYSNRYARYKQTSGNITLNSTTWANVNTASDLILNATTGDVIEYAVNGLVANAVPEAYFDVVSIVSASIVNSFGFDGTPANPTTSFGIVAWFCIGGSTQAIAGSFFRTLVAGDISSGQVTLRLRYATSSAVNRTVLATAAQPFEVWARNLGPVTT